VVATIAALALAWLANQRDWRPHQPLKVIAPLGVMKRNETHRCPHSSLPVDKAWADAASVSRTRSG